MWGGENWWFSEGRECYLSGLGEGRKRSGGFLNGEKECWGRGLSNSVVGRGIEKWWISEGREGYLSVGGRGEREAVVF